MASNVNGVHENQSSAVIPTSRFGEVEINQEKVITMTSPFLGFPDEKQFVLLPHGADSVFWWLQSTTNPKLAFVVIQPAIINPQYTPSISPLILKELKISSTQELELLVIITVPKGQPEQMTANLLGPIAFNASKKLAKQVLLDPSQYDACWPVMQDDQ